MAAALPTSILELASWLLPGLSAAVAAAIADWGSRWGRAVPVAPGSDLLAFSAARVTAVMAAAAAASALARLSSLPVLVVL